MVRQKYGLRPLHMSEARHYRVYMLLCAVNQLLLEIFYKRFYLTDLSSDIKPEIEGNLIIPGSCSMELLSARPYLLHESGLYVRVNVFKVFPKPELPGFYLPRYLLECINNFFGILS